MLLKHSFATGIAFALCWDTIVGVPGTVDIPISATTAEIDPGYSAVYYAKRAHDSLLLGVDGSAATGGFRTWSLFDDAQPLEELGRRTPGRTKAAGVVYGVAGKDLIVSIAAPDSLIRLFEVDGLKEIPSAQKKALGDWSALCPWRSPETGWQYFYLFGKKQAVQFVIREEKRKLEILEVQSFEIPVEPSSCAISPTDGIVYFAAEDMTIYNFQAKDSTDTPELSVLGEVDNDISGLAVYVAPESDYLFVAQTEIIEVYSTDLKLKGSMALTGAEDIEVAGLSIYQGDSERYGTGVLAFVVESDDGESYGFSSLDPVFGEGGFGLEPNTDYTPRPDDPWVEGPTRNGFKDSPGRLSCFSGFQGRNCNKFTCPNNCSDKGTCVGPNECKCKDSWAGPDCSFVNVEAKYETDANGGDGDDPAIWISPTSPDKSTIITTTKSEEGAGLAVFDLTGKFLQHFPAGEPNNVDVIYNFKAGNRTIDLAYAACREDDTLCLFEITPEGLLASIPGGKQPTPEDYSVYGSCVYRSPVSGKQYLFVNAKSAKYLQYELTWSPDGALSTTLVRSFTGGSGTQVEGCVTDEDAGIIFLGEEAGVLWRYDAEPDGSAEGTQIARVSDGTVYADVEGVALVEGMTPEEGFIIVSCQGVSAYSVFRRASPHEHIGMFTIGSSADGTIDAVTNTDGVAAVGTRLTADFPHGLVVTHDDANELPDGGGTHEMASFKLVSLADVLGKLEVLDEVDDGWDPRA